MEISHNFKVEGKRRTPAEALALAGDIERAVGELMTGKLKPARLDVGLLTGAVQSLRDHVRPAAEPETPRPSIAFMKGLIGAYYALDGNITGGSLHIVLDDGNLETEHVEWCVRWAAEKNDPDGVFLARLLLKFTDAERAQMLGIDGWDTDEEHESGA